MTAKPPRSADDKLPPVRDEATRALGLVRSAEDRLGPPDEDLGKSWYVVLHSVGSNVIPVFKRLVKLGRRPGRSVTPEQIETTALRIGAERQKSRQRITDKDVAERLQLDGVDVSEDTVRKVRKTSGRP